MVVRISITIPDTIHAKMIDFLKTIPTEKKKPNISKYVSGLIDINTPEIEKDLD